MSEFVKIANVEDVAKNGRIALEFNDDPILLFNVNGEFYAVADECSHKELPLEEGELQGCELECPFHGARFDLKTGEALSMPAVTPIMTYDLKIEDGAIYIHLRK